MANPIDCFNFPKSQLNPEKVQIFSFGLEQMSEHHSCVELYSEYESDDIQLLFWLGENRKLRAAWVGYHRD